jgi:hypothetical protein
MDASILFERRLNKKLQIAHQCGNQDKQIAKFLVFDCKFILDFLNEESRAS